MKQINAIVVGLGNTGKWVAQFLLEKEVNIVGAITRKSYLGEDLGEVIGLSPQGLKVSNDLEQVLIEQQADIAIVTTGSLLEEIYPVTELCLRHGVNVVTIAEEAFTPPAESDLVNKLNAVALENNASLLATGVQDIFWFEMPTSLTAGCQTMELVIGQSMVNVDYSGPAVLEHYPLGFTEKEYYEIFEGTEYERHNVFGPTLELLVNHLGFTIVKRTSQRLPLFEDVDIRCNSLNKTLKKGTNVGAREIHEVETSEGTTWRVEFLEKVCREDEKEFISWEVKGVPNLSMMLKDFPGMEATLTAVVNRIPDVINAQPGFLTVCDMPKMQFRIPPLGQYLE